MDAARAKSPYFRLLARNQPVLEQRTLTDKGIFYTPGGLPRAERELAATVASKINGCIYCASVHARKAAQLAKDETAVDTLLAVTPGDDLRGGQSPRWQAEIDAAAALSVVICIALWQSRGAVDVKDVTVGGFVSFITAMLMLIAPIRRLADVASPVTRGVAALERGLGLLGDTGAETSRISEQNIHQYTSLMPMARSTSTRQKPRGLASSISISSPFPRHPRPGSPPRR